MYASAQSIPRQVAAKDWRKLYSIRTSQCLGTRKIHRASASCSTCLDHLCPTRSLPDTLYPLARGISQQIAAKDRRSCTRQGCFSVLEHGACVERPLRAAYISNPSVWLRHHPIPCTLKHEEPFDRLQPKGKAWSRTLTSGQSTFRYLVPFSTRCTSTCYSQEKGLTDTR